MKTLQAASGMHADFTLTRRKRLHVFATRGALFDTTRKSNMPRDFGFVAESHGLLSIVGQLGVSPNFHGSAREIFFDAAPSAKLDQPDRESAPGRTAPCQRLPARELPREFSLRCVICGRRR